MVEEPAPGPPAEPAPAKVNLFLHVTGRRADDLACLVAHLTTIQRMNGEQTERVHRLIRDWVPVFDERVDPIELRLRAAAVIISLATGPYRGQEPDWQRETLAMLDAAEALVRQVA